MFGVQCGKLIWGDRENQNFTMNKNMGIKKGFLDIYFCT